MKLPLLISLKKACLNIKNQDDESFKYVVLWGFHQIYEKSHPEFFYR